MHDVVIVGCGIAGMTSAIYLARAGKKVLILERDTIGGQIASSPLVENFPGYKSISGSELSNNIYEQVENLNIDVEIEDVLKIEKGDIKKVITDDNTYECKSIILATGAKYRLLGLENEENLIGNGLHFCVACDGAFYKDKVVAVIGGGNSAIVNVNALSDICRKVYVIQNLDDLTCELSLKRQLSNKDNVEVICSSVVTRLIGDEFLEGIVIKNTEEREIKLDGMFISIGLVPQSELASNFIDLDKYNYILSDDCKTNVDGIFVAGDCRTKKYRQLTTAANDGTISAMEAIRYLDTCK
ncbi:MAG: FAD-dependent oxidoreductase [Bacilli bacterium]|nr:FAD-dependent oxidoreductase [Bacilli bacterium]